MNEPESPAAVQPEPDVPAFHAVVEEWFVTHFHNLGDRISTETFNAFHAAKEELKSLLEPHLK